MWGWMFIWGACTYVKGEGTEREATPSPMNAEL